MFIKKIEIGQFGNLKDVAFEFRPAANLIVAPNEWGKSTLIDFIFAVFYGMDRNKPQNLRSSNRSRNMPWGQDTMSGVLFFESDNLDYRVSCEFGAQPRMDRIVLTDESLGKTYEINDEPLGKRIFGLGEQSFNQSVYVQQMSLALNVKDDKKGELLHQLASLGTAGTSEISSAAVSNSLNEALLSLSSSRRRNAIIPMLETERFHLREKLAEARMREEREAEELLELQALEAEVDLLAGRVEGSERKLRKTEYLIQLQNLQDSVGKEQAIKEQEKHFQKQLEQLEILEPPANSEEFFALENDIKQLQIESSVLDNTGKNLEIERGAMQHELDQAYKTYNSSPEDTDEELNFNERRQELRRRDQACNKELRSIYVRQQQIEMNRSGIEEKLTATEVPETQEKEKKLKNAGFALASLAFVAALLLGIIWHPAAYSFVLIGILGFFFFRKKSGDYSSDRTASEQRYKELESRLAEADLELSEVNAEVEELESQLLLLEEKLNKLEEIELQVRQRHQEAKVREENYLNNQERHLERKKKFCDAIDSLIAGYPYLNTDAIVDKIKFSQDLPQLTDLEYSNHNMNSVYTAELFEVERDADKRRYNNAIRMFKRFAHSYSELNNYVQDLQQSRERLRGQLRVLSSDQGSERLLPSQSRQQLLEKAAEENLPSDDRTIAIAIEEEYYPEDLNKSATRRKQELQFNRSNYNQALGDYSKKLAHMSLAYRHSERSENIKLRLEELEERIEKAESRVRHLELARKYLLEADEEMRRNFSPELRALTARYLERLTIGRYDDVLIDEDMKLHLHLTGETQFREAEYMSGGCYDQVYLALRLALSELITGEMMPPLILDDILVQFDEDRMKAALDLLAELSREASDEDLLGESRQILLFSCHERVAELAETVGGFDIQRM